jgi:hypothetical protein
MNDRDYFAAAALAGLLMNGDYSTDSIPSLAYSMADSPPHRRLRSRSAYFVDFVMGPMSKRQVRS